MGGRRARAHSNISEGGFKGTTGFKVNNAAVFTQMPSEVRASARRGRQVGAKMR